MSVIGDKRDLQSVLNSVYAGAVKECEGREREGKLVGNGHHMAQSIVEHVKIELLKRGLFVNFDGPVHLEPDQSPTGLIIQQLVDEGFRELSAKNVAEGGCGCAPGTVLCPH